MSFVYYIVLSFYVFVGFTQSEQTSIEEKIVGTWINEGDTNWQIEFKEDGNAINRYLGESTITFNYVINNAACDGSITTDDYLKLIHPTEEDFAVCYYIHGITETEEDGVPEFYLSIEAFNNPRPFLFKKKKQQEIIPRR